jgi:hypothetical protein
MLDCMTDYNINNDENDELNSVALVCKQTIPTEGPPLVGEVSAKFAERRCHVASATNSTDVNFDYLDPEPLLAIQVDPQLHSRGWVDPRSRHITSQKIC